MIRNTWLVQLCRARQGLTIKIGLTGCLRRPLYSGIVQCFAVVVAAHFWSWAIWLPAYLIYVAFGYTPFRHLIGNCPANWMGDCSTLVSYDQHSGCKVLFLLAIALLTMTKKFVLFMNVQSSKVLRRISTLGELEITKVLVD